MAFGHRNPCSQYMSSLPGGVQEAVVAVLVVVVVAVVVVAVVVVAAEVVVAVV